MTDSPFTSTIESVDELRTLYRAPTDAVLEKETQTFDQGCVDFIAASTLVLVGTSDTDGHLDTSPQGGPAGFVKVLDEQRPTIPDLNGNNRLDSLQNIIEQPSISLLFVIPGLGETLRVNGEAQLTTDDAALDLFTDELRRPKCAIGATITHGFIHCAKAFRRGGLWAPDTWPTTAGRPSAGQILVDHSGAGDVMTGEQLETILEEAYENELARRPPRNLTSGRNHHHHRRLRASGLSWYGYSLDGFLNRFIRKQRLQEFVPGEPE